MYWSSQAESKRIHFPRLKLSLMLSKCAPKTSNPTPITPRQPLIIRSALDLRQKNFIESLIIAFQQSSTLNRLRMDLERVDESQQKVAELQTHAKASLDFLQIIIPSVLGIQKQGSCPLSGLSIPVPSFQLRKGKYSDQKYGVQSPITTFQLISELNYPCDINFQSLQSIPHLLFAFATRILPRQSNQSAVPWFHQPKKQTTSKLALHLCGDQTRLSLPLPPLEQHLPTSNFIQACLKCILLEIRFFQGLQTREHKYRSNYFEENFRHPQRLDEQTENNKGEESKRSITRRRVNRISRSDGCKLSHGPLDAVHGSHVRDYEARSAKSIVFHNSPVGRHTFSTVPSFECCNYVSPARTRSPPPPSAPDSSASALYWPFGNGLLLSSPGR